MEGVICEVFFSFSNHFQVGGGMSDTSRLVSAGLLACLFSVKWKLEAFITVPSFDFHDRETVLPIKGRHDDDHDNVTAMFIDGCS